MYVIHLVPNAPLQRIFYEIYRDRAAFDSHETQPYMQRFVAERRSCVLATNVIELRLKYAKVAPLPNPQASAPGRAPPARLRRRPLPGRSCRPAHLARRNDCSRCRPAPLARPPPGGSRGVRGLVEPQRHSEPRGFSRCLRSGRSVPTCSVLTCSAHFQRPDQRQVPSAGRRYEG